MISANLLASPTFSPALFLQTVSEDALPELQRQLLEISQAFNEPAQNAAQYAFDALLNAQNAVDLTETAVNHVQQQGAAATQLVESFKAEIAQIEQRELQVRQVLEEKLAQKQRILNSIRVQRAVQKDDFFDPQLMEIETDQRTRELLSGRKAAYLTRLFQENQNLLNVAPSFAQLAAYFPAELTEYVQKQFTEELITKLIRKLQFDEQQQVTNIVQVMLQSCANLPRTSFKYKVSPELLLRAVVIHAAQMLRKSFSAFFSLACYKNNLFLHISMMKLAHALGITDKTQAQHQIADACQLAQSACAYLRFLAGDITDTFRSSETFQEQPVRRFFVALFGYTGCVFDAHESNVCGGVFNAFVAVDVAVQCPELLAAVCKCPFDLIDQDQLQQPKGSKRHFIYLQREAREPVRRCCFKTDTERQLRQFLALILRIYVRERQQNVSQDDFDALRGEECSNKQYEAYLTYKQMIISVFEQEIRRLISKTREYARIPFAADVDLTKAVEMLREDGCSAVE